MGETSKEVESLEEPLSKLGINVIMIVRTQSYHILTTLIININYAIHKITLFDIGIDQNCIIEGIITNKYLDKGTIRLFPQLKKSL